MIPERQEDRAGDGPAGLIGLDWGTSSLRGWLFGPGGEMLDRKEAPLGILAVRDGRFVQAFETFCGSWLAAGRADLPVIASGMIGSRQGWREARYLETPAHLEALAEGLLVLDDEAGRPFRIVPGLVTRPPEGSPDVMRGEETQVFGALAAAGGVADVMLDFGEKAGSNEATNAHCAKAKGNGAKGADRSNAGARLFVLPGTHSKWVAVKNGTLERFRSYMTGEIFAVMREHSILGRLCVERADPEGPGPLSAFDDGVARALAEPGALGHLLFTVRTEGLLGDRPSEHLSAYLSGLLIGAELADALRVLEQERDGGVPLTIIASAGLAARYRRAMHQAGLFATVAEGNPAAAGLYAIARCAGFA